MSPKPGKSPSEKAVREIKRRTLRKFSTEGKKATKLEAGRKNNYTVNTRITHKRVSQRL